MPAVPYSPVPSVSPQDSPAPSIHENTPIGAFGGQVAEAVQGLGAVTDKAGNELFGRAVAIQQLQNETEAREADAQYMMQAGQVHAQFNALQGKDRVDAYPKYSQDLQDLRVKLRGGLSNPMAQKMYDSSSLGTMGRSIFNGAGAAAAAQKEWSIGTVKSQLDLDVQSIADNPRDEGGFQQKLAKIQGSARALAAQQGLGDGSAQEQDLVAKATSKAWGQRLVELSHTAPFEAVKMLNDNKASLRADDFAHVDNAVRTQVRAVGSSNIANEVYSPDKSLKDAEAEARDKAKAMDPQDPVLESHAVAAVQHRYNQEHFADQREKVTNEQVVLEALQKGVKNEQELFADPATKAAYDALPAKSSLKTKPINFQINQYNNQADAKTMDDNWVRLKGMASNDELDFLNADIQGTRLAPAKRDALLAARDKIIKQQGGGAHTQAAMQVIRGGHAAELQALGLFHRDPKSPEDFDHFTGSLESALDTYLDTNKKPADAKTINEQIFPQLIRNVTEEGRFFGTNQVPAFKPNTYTKDYQDFSTSYGARMGEGGVVPSDEETYRAYQRMQYQKLYGKAK
jgi:hypothetical protein